MVSIMFFAKNNETDKSFECRELSRRLRACAQKKSILRGSGESYGYSYEQDTNDLLRLDIKCNLGKISSAELPDSCQQAFKAANALPMREFLVRIVDGSKSSYESYEEDTNKLYRMYLACRVGNNSSAFYAR